MCMILHYEEQFHFKSGHYSAYLRQHLRVTVAEFDGGYALTHLLDRKT